MNDPASLLMRRASFTGTVVSAFTWDTTGAYEVVCSEGRTVAIQYPDRDPLFNEQHRLAPTVAKYLK